MKKSQGSREQRGFNPTWTKTTYKNGETQTHFRFASQQEEEVISPRSLPPSPCLFVEHKNLKTKRRKTYGTWNDWTRTDGREIDAETTPLRNPEYYQYDFNLGDIAEVWRRGSVIASWLLDLTAIALLSSPNLEEFGGRVSDSGKGRWTAIAAIDESVPAPVLSAALFARFSSRGEADFADKLLSAMRYQFGGHHEKANS
ncbi:hypothetical protein [Nostoc sp.]|uniref:hypothetical protein n=1 Tax=Nostoc sp. TaxID=1180 RepID=UPI002FF51440